jgi:hypothetical protein
MLNNSTTTIQVAANFADRNNLGGDCWRSICRCWPANLPYVSIFSKRTNKKQNLDIFWQKRILFSYGKFSHCLQYTQYCTFNPCSNNQCCGAGTRTARSRMISVRRIRKAMRLRLLIFPIQIFNNFSDVK